MTTSDIAIEKVQARLKIDDGNGCLQNHLVRVARALALEGGDSTQLMQLSSLLKLTAFKPAAGPDVDQHAALDAAAEELRQRWCAHSLEIARSPSDPLAAPKVIATVQNFLEDAAMFEWAGVGFGRQESFSVAMSLRKLAAQIPSLQRLRLWGKIFGTQGDLYVAEGSLQQPPPGPTPPPPALPGTPEYDVEPRGEGANSFTYWVSEGGSAPWVRLPAARGSYIAASRNIKRLLTGQLNSPVVSAPQFPGSEQHLLRSQIARITSSCTLAVRGYYEVDEEAGKNQIKEVENAAESFPAYEELATQAGWAHAAPFLLSTGKSTWPDTEALEAAGVSEEAMKEIQQQAETEAEHAMLEPIEADLEELKGEDAGSSPAWSIKVYGDQGLYSFGDAQKTYRVTAVRSMIWPGAITVAQGTRFANLYVGYAMKSGTLVPVNKESGLPLRGSTAMLPLAPEDIMEEPVDLEEQDEPNPQQEDVESDKGDVDDEP